MEFTAQIPYGAYWATPLAKWQGSLSHLHSIEFGAYVAKNELAKRNISPEVFDYGVLGMTIPQNKSFQGLPWFTGMIGASHVAGPTISQVCATGIRCIQDAVQNIECDDASVALVATVDRLSNGPQLYYPDPSGVGGAGRHENLTLYNMQNDALGGHSMLECAENVAKKHQITTEEQHELVILRREQYELARENDSSFLKRFMTLPFEVPSVNYKKIVSELDGDEGVFKSDPEKLAKLKPVLDQGTVTYGGQTHPADGSACLVIASPEKADQLSSNKDITVYIRGFGMSRAKNGYMPEAPVPAAHKALKAAGLSLDNIDAIKTHNPFAVNDIYFVKQTNYDVRKMNNYGCSLIHGHPHAPVGVRGIIELIEELTIRGGGFGLFTGCAAGDTGLAAIIEVKDR